MIQTLPEQIKSLFVAGYSIDQIAQFLDLTNNGIEVAGAVGGGLFWLIKKLRTRRIIKTVEKRMSKLKCIQIKVLHLLFTNQYIICL